MRKLGLALLIGMSVVSVSCTKKRTAKFAYGEGTDLMAISDYQDKEFTASTTKEKEVYQTSKAEDVGSNKGGAKQSFALMEFTTDAKLLPTDIPFKGLIGTKYKIKYKVDEKYLTIYKVASAETTPDDEETYAETIKDGDLLAVPLMAYPVTGLFVIDQARNENDLKTSKLIERSVKTVSEATHFKIDRGSRELFKALEKIDVFNASVFEGDWYFSTTAVATRDDNATWLGGLESYDAHFAPATKVRFVKTAKDLKALNTNIDERLQKDLNDKNDQILNLPTVLSIPIEWKSYKRDKVGTVAGMREEEEIGVPTQERRHIKVNFEEASTPGDLFTFYGGSGEQSFAIAPTGKRLVDLQITKDFISFVLQNDSGNVRMRYSFLKAEARNYEPKTYFQSDFKYFGYFNTKKQTARSYEKYRRDDFEKNIFISRFNPKASKITYHFTSATPKTDRVRDIGRKAIAAWNLAFKNAGTDISVELDESIDVDLGDIRYNTINLIETFSDTDLFGFGPVITDPFTGEIISASSNVHLTTIKASVISFLRNYIRHKLGEFDNDYLPFNKTSLFSPWLDNSGQASSNISLANKQIEMGRRSPISQVSLPVNGKWETFKLSQSKGAEKFITKAEFGHANSALSKDVERICSQEITAHIANRKSFGNKEISNELAAVEACADKIVPVKALGTLVHELGHNFGLRHNFAASTDSANFYTADKKEDVIRSSSTMEYTNFSEDRLTTTGFYDIEAIRFGYADGVRTIDDKIIPLSKGETIDQALSRKAATKRPIKFCTDDHVQVEIDPMCARHDAGTTPLEKVDRLIADFNASYVNLHFKRDKAGSPNKYSALGYMFAVELKSMVDIYAHWRVVLADFVGQNNGHLKGLNGNDYYKILDRMDADPKFGPLKRAYLPAADKVYSFLEELVFMPVKYCLVKNGKGKLDAIELSALVNQAIANGDLNANSCSDQAVGKVLKAKNMEFLKEAGTYFEDITFDKSIEGMLDIGSFRGTQRSVDILGLDFLRSMAVGILTERLSSPLLSLRGLSPNFFDEPVRRDQFEGRLIERIRDGVALSDIDWDLRNQSENKPFYIQSYSTEFGFLGFVYGAFTQSLTFPGDPGLSYERASPLLTTKGLAKDMPEDALAIPIGNNQFVGASQSGNPISYQLMMRYMTISNLESITNESLKRAADMIIAHINKINYLKDSSGTEALTPKLFLEFMESLINAFNETKDQTLIQSGKRLLAPYFQLQMSLLNLKKAADEGNQEAVARLDQPLAGKDGKPILSPQSKFGEDQLANLKVLQQQLTNFDEKRGELINQKELIKNIMIQVAN